MKVVSLQQPSAGSMALGNMLPQWIGSSIFTQDD
jgi:hypothetical protein